MLISGNTVDTAGHAGIYVKAPDAMVTNNVVRGASARGIETPTTIHATALNNRVTRSGSDGIVMSGPRILARGNVVGRSFGRGLAGDGDAVTFASNTSYLNATAGIELTGTASADTIDRKISFGNITGLR